MKYSNFFLLLFCMGAVMSCSRSQLETPVEFQLSNGLCVYLLKTKTLPYVQYDLVVPSGSSTDSVGKEGLAFLTAKMLERGTQKDSALALTKKLENLGTQFVSRVYKDYAVFSADTLSWHQDTLLSVFSDIITQPLFSEKEIQWVQKQNLTKIEKRPENTSSFAHQILAKMMFQNKKYSHSPLGYKTTVQKLTTQDVVHHYKTFFSPQNSTLGVTGQYPKNIQDKLEKAFSKWKSSNKKVQSCSKYNQPSEPLTEPSQKLSQKINQKRPSFSIRSDQVSIIHQPGLFQSEIRIGKPFISRTSSDYLPVQLANIILGGGGLDSRLFTEVREKHGLTYHIQSQIVPLAKEGILNILTPTRLEVTRKTIEHILKVMEDFYQKGVTSDELLKAKKSYKIRLLKNHERAETRLLRFIILKHLGLDYDLDNLSQNLKKIQLKEVYQIIQKYYSPDNIQFIIFSDFNKIKDQFKDMPQLKIQNFDQFL